MSNFSRNLDNGTHLSIMNKKISNTDVVAKSKISNLNLMKSFDVTTIKDKISRHMKILDKNNL